MSLNIFLHIGTAPPGNFLIGRLGQRYSVPVAILSMAGMCALGVSLGWIYLARHPLQERQPAPQLQQLAQHD